MMCLGQCLAQNHHWRNTNSVIIATGQNSVLGDLNKKINETQLY